MNPYVVVLTCAMFFLEVSQTSAQEQKLPAPQRQKKTFSYDELAKAPPKARAKRNPLDKDPEAPVAGRILFEQHCVECHGDTAEGGKKAPSLRAEEVQSAPAGAIFWILTNGVVRRGMPVWSRLPEPQRWQLVTYIKSLGVTPAPPNGIVPTPPH